MRYAELEQGIRCQSKEKARQRWDQSAIPAPHPPPPPNVKPEQRRDYSRKGEQETNDCQSKQVSPPNHLLANTEPN
jgi:hypothetical protein